MATATATAQVFVRGVSVVSTAEDEKEEDDEEVISL